MTRLCLTDAQARAFHSGRLRVVFVEMKPQPADHPWKFHKSYRMEHKMMLTDKGWFCKFWHRIDENPENDGDQWIRAPYQPGEVCFIGETWEIDLIVGHFLNGSESGEEGKKIYYKSDHTFPNMPAPITRWNSPVTLPEALSRAHVRIGDVRPVEVEGIDAEWAQYAGFMGSYCKDEDGIKDELMSPEEMFLLDWHARKRGKWAWLIPVEKV